MTQSTIDLDAFIGLLDGQVDEGNNGSFYLDESGIRAIVPDVSERQSIGLFSAEKEALRQFERDCRLSFPCTIQDVRQWIERTGEADMPDGMDAKVNQAAPTDNRGQPRKIPVEVIDYYNSIIDQGAKPLIAHLIVEVVFDAEYSPDSLRIASKRRREQQDQG